MKKGLLSMIAAAAAMLCAGCEQFSTSYQRIESTEFRLLDFMYSPADAAPGDTVTLVAVFAGKRVDTDAHIDWWVSFNVITDMFGGQTVVDSTRLEPLAQRVDTTFSENTQTVAFRVPVPEDIVRASASIPEAWGEMLHPAIRNMLAPDLLALTKGEMIDLIESGQMANPQILQLFTVPMRITARMHEPGRLPHAIHSRQSIRYNSRLAAMGIPDVPVNNNPAVDSIVTYKVRGKNLLTFNPETQSVAAAFRLDDADEPVIEVEDGFSYFMVVYSNGSIDSTITMDGNRAAERHLSYWQFTLDSEEIAGTHHSRFMDFGSVTGTHWTLTPPRSRRITRFTFWLTLKDEAANVRLRPEGSVLVEINGRFVYR
jgi:hypothetical protein